MFTIFTKSSRISKYLLHPFEPEPVIVTHQLSEVVDNGRACLASAMSPSPRIYVTGLGDGTVNFDYFDLHTGEWRGASNLPQMSISRSTHGCIVANNSLWVVGGQNVISIESIKIGNIENAEWITNDYNLPAVLYDFGIVVIENLIYTIGGIGPDESVVKSVNIIDTATGRVTSDELSFEVQCMPAVAVDGIIYGFGGCARQIGDDADCELQAKWVTHEMLSAHDVYCDVLLLFVFQNCLTDQRGDRTSVPTSSPSNAPSESPTSSPSVTPSNSPSVEPTLSPTTIPTNMPTQSTTVPASLFCDALYVFISDFTEVTADALNANKQIQSTMSGITHEAIAESSTAYDVDEESFSVHFRNATGSLSIILSLCASEKATLNTLQLVIESSSSTTNISAALESRFADEFGLDHDSLVVTVSLTQFRLLHFYFRKPKMI